MTTSVIVKAHCDSKTTQVRVDAADDPDGKAIGDILQDGEEKEFFVYDDRVVSVREIQKNTNSD